MPESDDGLFRQKAIDKMSSPDELTDYLKVTSPSVWAVLTAVVVLLAGIIAWACVGTLPTKAEASIVVQGGTALVSVTDSYDIGEGMRVSVESHNSAIDSITADDHGRHVGLARLDLPDGTYKGTVVVDETRAIDFLLQST